MGPTEQFNELFNHIQSKYGSKLLDLSASIKYEVTDSGEEGVNEENFYLNAFFPSPDIECAIGYTVTETGDFDVFWKYIPMVWEVYIWDFYRSKKAPKINKFGTQEEAVKFYEELLNSEINKRNA